MEVAERDMTIIAIFGIEDPIRKEVPGAVCRCQDAGIRVVMVTGDHVETAVAIGKQSGILEETFAFDQSRSAEQCKSFSNETKDQTGHNTPPPVWLGPDFRALSPKQQAVVAKTICVLARSSP